MQIVIDIPDEQVKKSLEESKYIHEDEGAKGSVNIVMLYTNGRLDFVDVSRKEDFYSCEYKILPKGHGDLIDISKLPITTTYFGISDEPKEVVKYNCILNAKKIIKADNTGSEKI